MSKEGPADFYGTQELARMVNLTRHTINDLFDAGYLTGYRLPDSRYRRVSRRSASDFIRKLNEMAASNQT